MLNKYDVWVGSPDNGTVGPILSAPVGTVEVPTTVDDPDEGFTGSGYISADGLSVSINKSFTDIRDWSLSVVRRILTEYSGEFTWRHISNTVEAWKNFAGDQNVTFEEATAEHGNRGIVQFNAEEAPRKSWKFKIKDGPRKLVIYVPDGQAQGNDALEFKADTEQGLPITMTTFPDKEGNHFYILWDDGTTQAVRVEDSEG